MSPRSQNQDNSELAKRNKMHIMANLLDRILDRQNMYEALKRIYPNK